VTRRRTKPTEAGEAARAWRERAGLTCQQLADLTGYAIESIYYYERGRRHDGTKVSEYAWQRYRMACAGVAAQLASGRAFEW
jgi:transcriptional regulator with XRE-family HTH domain